MPDGQVVGTALTAAIGSLIIISALFFVWRLCGPGRPYFKKGDDDDYYTERRNRAANKKKQKKARDEEAGVVLPELDPEGKRTEGLGGEEGKKKKEDGL